MAINLSSNPTCVLSDADNLTAEQRQKINLNLTKDIPGSNISGDKVTVINSKGEVEMKSYSAGGGGSSYTAGDGIRIADDVISAKIDGTSITLNGSGELQAAGGSGATLHILEYGTTPLISADQANAWINAGDIIVAKYDNNFFNLARYSVYKANNRDMRGNLREEDPEELVRFNFTGIATGYYSADGMQPYDISYTCIKYPGGSPSDNWGNTHASLNNLLPNWNGADDDGKILKIVDGQPTWVTP